MTRNQGAGLSAAVGIAFLLACLGCLWPVEGIFYIAAGWAFFLARVVPQVTVSPTGVLTGMLGLAGFATGLHLFLRWLCGAAAHNPDTPPRRWRLRWTFQLTGLVVVMFAAGIATVGVLHQIGWLVTSPEPLIGGGIRVPAARSRSSNNLKQMVLAAHNYSDAHEDKAAHSGQLPPGCTTDRFGNPLHGWQALVLPYMEYESLHGRIRFDRPWNAPENRSAYETSIPAFLIPYPPLPDREDGYVLSHYAGNVHVLPPSRGLRLPADFKDGTSNTLFAGEVSAGFRPWGHPLNLRDPGRGIRATADAFSGPRPGGTPLFAMADGSVRSIKPTISPAVLKALATPAGGDDPGTDWDQ